MFSFYGENIRMALLPSFRLLTHAFFYSLPSLVHPIITRHKNGCVEEEKNVAWKVFHWPGILIFTLLKQTCTF